MKIMIEAKYIKDVLEAIGEPQRIDALFELKREYNRVLKRGILLNVD